MSRRLSFHAAIALSAVLLSTTPRPAQGQSPEAKAQAAALLEEGKKLLNSNDFARACKALEGSQKLDPAVVTMLYLADCYEQIGKTASAWAMFREAAQIARKTNQSSREAAAQRRASEVAPKVPKLTLQVEGEAPGLQLLRNGEPVARETWGMSVPVDPGLHVYEASAPGKKTFRIEVEVKPGEEARTIVIKLIDGAPQPTTSASAPTSAPPSTAPGPRKGPGGQKIAGWVLGGAGLLTVGVGSFLAFSARNKSNDADALCRPEDRTRCTPQGASAGNDARSSANLATVVVSIGGGLLAGGVLLLLLPSSDPAPSARLSPAVGPNLAGLSFQGFW